MAFPDDNRKEVIMAYPFFSEEGAIAAVEVINIGEGIPSSEDAVTTTYTTPIEHNGMWYIKSDAVTDKYLTEAVEIEISI